jgi:translation initiation factor IF-3
MSYKIDQHDFDVRMRAVRKFLGDGDKVKVVVQFKGNEIQQLFLRMFFFYLLVRICIFTCVNLYVITCVHICI